MAVSTMQGDSQLREQLGLVALLRDTPTHLEEPGIELATFRSPANPLNLLSRMLPQRNGDFKFQVYCYAL